MLRLKIEHYGGRRQAAGELSNTKLHTTSKQNIAKKVNIRAYPGGAENVGPENAGPENGGPNRRA